jgi:hypothetical protein
MPHIGQPAFGVKEAIVDDDGEKAFHKRQPHHVTSFLMANASDNIVTVFDNFRAEIDDHNDRRERLIKVSSLSFLIFHLTQILSHQASRDITNLAKKTIFLLHRLVQEDEADVTAGKKASQQAYTKLREIQDLYAKLQPELQGDRFWRYQRQVSPGLQEYIEALSFAHYLEHGSLITFEEVQRTLMDSEGVEVCLIKIVRPSLPLRFSDGYSISH